MVIRAYCPDERLFVFIDAISTEAPPLADISSISFTPLDPPLVADTFSIIASRSSKSTQAVIPPDIAICADCLRELDDPDDFRFGYPFINCTNCGPRFTITESIPYDRPKTSMKVFPMCPTCKSEYDDPTNRRFHAQPNACPTCGPKISWHRNDGTEIADDTIIASAVQALANGKVLAVRGLGGFHLCVDAFSETAVNTLRERKKRPEKPLAVMAANIETVQELCYLSQKEETELLSPQHPIVLLRQRRKTPLSPNLNPGVSDIGIMLPYTPLHHLLFTTPDCPRALVMTSGNISGAPICTANNDALEKLCNIADYFLLHNRDIVTRVDDSVIKFMEGEPRTLRRARGYVPTPIRVPYDLPEIIGCGGGLKSTFSLACGTSIFPSQHIGDLFNLASFEFYSESVENLKKVFRIVPKAAACDMHPDYMSSRYAEELGLPIYKIQHHHAHAVAVMAEHGLTDPVLAVVLDGTGYGTDSTIWGGEILKTGLEQFSRLGSLETMLLPGGDTATSEPWRMALSLLYQIKGSQGFNSPLLSKIDASHRTIVGQMLESRFNTPLTSSCGRLFDGIASLLGLAHFTSYEGQAAMQLESCARKALTISWKNRLIRALDDDLAYGFKENTQRWEIISSDFIKNIVYDVSSGKKPPELALSFHCWLISCISRLVEKLSETTGIKQVTLSGGCMQNSIILEGLIFTLTELGLQPFTGARIPINDGGISVGQAIIGGLRHVSGSTDES